MKKEILRWLFCWLLLCCSVSADFLLQGAYAEGSTISEQLQKAGLADKIKLIWGYHGGEWQLYAGESFSVERYGLSPLTEIKPGYGYWISYKDNVAPVSIYNQGTAPVALSISGHGYVLADFRLTQETDFSQFINGLTVEKGSISDLTEIWVYNSDSDNWYFYSGQPRDEYSLVYASPQTLRPRDAFWIKTARSGLVLRPSGADGAVFEVQASVQEPVILPESLVLESSSCVLFTGEQFDLSGIEASVRYTDDTSAIARNLQWAVQTDGGGSIDSFSYTAPLVDGSFVVRASYAEDGIIKTADFAVMVRPKLDKLIFSSDSVEIFAGGELDLSTIVVQADYLHDVPDQPLSAGQVNWQKISGTGSLTEEGVYASTTSSGTVVLRASYTENGIIASADLTVKMQLRPLSLQINPASLNLFVNEQYDLAQIQTRLNYEYGSYRFLSFAEQDWIIMTDSGGSIIQGIYNTPSTTRETVLCVSFSESETVLSTDLVMTVVRRLQSISLSPQSISLKTNQEYDLRNVQVSADYGEGTPQVLSSFLVNWSLGEGATGTLESVNYKSGKTTGVIPLIATYTDSGITKTAEFSVEVQRSLKSIALSPRSTELNFNASYDLKNIVLSAHYDDGYSQVISNSDLCWLPNALGSLSNEMVFTAGTNPGTATLLGIYQSGDVDEMFYFDIVISRNLQSISLLENSAVVHTGSEYALSEIDVVVTYEDASTETVAANTRFDLEVISGSGSLSSDGSVFNSGNTSGTAVLRISYTLGGVTRTADFSFTVIRSLTTLVLSPDKTTIHTKDVYALGDVQISALYDDGYNHPVVSSMSWSKSSGSGTIEGSGSASVFRAASTSGVSVMRASYTSGSRSAGADFPLTVLRSLSSIRPAYPSTIVHRGDGYSLDNAGVRAYYDDGYIYALNAGDMLWTKSSGPGSISGTESPQFMAGSTTGTAVLQASYSSGGRQAETSVNIDVLPVLQSVELSLDSTSIFTNESYAVGLLQITAVYDDYSELISQNSASLSWEIVSGSGTLSSTGTARRFYPDYAGGETQLRLKYNYGHLQSSADFTIQATARNLVGLQMNPSSASLYSSEIYFLRDIILTASYSDSHTITVALSSPGLSWSIESGSGSLIGSDDSRRLRAGDVSGPLLLRADFVSGAFRADAYFSVNVLRTLTGVALSLDTTSVYNGESFPFAGIAVDLLYNDGDVVAGNRDKIIWDIDYWSGEEGQEGNISGTGSSSVFTPGSTTGQAEIMAMYRHENTGADPVTFTTGFMVNVLSPLSSVQLSELSTIVYTNEEYILSNLEMQAFYGNGYNYAVEAADRFVIHSGAGFIDGSGSGAVFRSDSSTGQAVLQFGYEIDRVNGGKMSVTTNFVVDILPVLQGINLNSGELGVHAGYDLDLSELGFTASYNDGSQNYYAEPGSLLSWTRLSGDGNLVGSVFTAGNLTGTAELQAVYTVEKLSGGQMLAQTNLSVNILRSLTGILPYPVSTSLPTGAGLPLNMVSLTAFYNDGYSYVLPSSTENLSWSTTSLSWNLTGVGTNSVFHSGSLTGMTTLVAEYSYGETSVSTEFVVEIFGTLESITLSHYSTAIYSSGSFSEYGLNDVVVSAHFSDGAIRTLNPEQTGWQKMSGPDALNGGNGNAVFSSAGTSGTAVLRASYSFGSTTKTTDFSINIFRTLDRITLPSYAVQIYTGGSHALSGSNALTARYDDGFTERLNPGTDGLSWTVESAPFGATLTDADSVFQAGSQTGTALLSASFSWGGLAVTTELSIAIMRSITGISLSTTTTSIYYKGGTCALDNIVVSAVYDDGYTYAVLPAQVGWSLFVDKGGTLSNRVFTAGSTSGSIGQASVNAAYLGKTTRFHINVLPILESITAQPSVIGIYTGDEFSLGNIVISAHYDGAATSTVSSSALSWSTVSLNDSGSLNGSVFSAGHLTGEAALRTSYQWGPVTVKNTDVLINVLPPLSSLSLSYKSTSVYTAEILPLDDILVTAHYADNSSELLDLTDLSWSLFSPPGIGTVFTGDGGYSTFTAGTSTGTAVLRVSYSSGRETRTTDFNVNIVGTLISIYPTCSATEIYTNGHYDLADITLRAVYDDSFELDIDLDSPSLSWEISSGSGSISGSGADSRYNAPTSTGTVVLMATYSSGKETKTTNFSLLIKPSLSSFQLVPSATAIHTGEIYNLQNIAITGVYDDGRTELIPFSSGRIAWTTQSVTSSGVLTSSSSAFAAGVATGENVLVVSHVGGNTTAQFTITVHRSLSHLRLSPERKNLNRWASYDLNDVAVTAVYDDGYELSLLSTDTGLQWQAKVLVTGTDYNTGTRVFTASNTKDYSEFSLTYTTDKISSGRFSVTTDFEVDVVDPLTGIALYDYTESPLTSTIITRNSSYDLRHVIVRAEFLDEFDATYDEDIPYTSEYLIWSAVSLVGENALAEDKLTFISKNDTGDNFLRASYSWGSSVETADLKITVQPGISSISFAYAETYVYMNDEYELSNLSPMILSDAEGAVPEAIAVGDLIWTIISEGSPGYLGCFLDGPSNQKPSCFSSDAVGSTTLQAGYYSVLGEFKTTQVVIESLRKIDRISVSPVADHVYTGLTYDLKDNLQVRLHYIDGFSELAAGENLDLLHWQAPVSGGSLNSTTFADSVFTAGTATGTYTLTLDLIRPDITKSTSFSMEVMRTLTGIDLGTGDITLYFTQNYRFTPQLVYDDGYREPFSPVWTVTNWTGGGSSDDAGVLAGSVYMVYNVPGELTLKASGANGPFSVSKEVKITILSYSGISWIYKAGDQSLFTLDGGNNIYFNGGLYVYRVGSDGELDWQSEAATSDMTDYGNFLSQPAIGDLHGTSGSVYAAHFLGRIYARNVSDGSARWMADINAGIEQTSTELWDFFAGSAPVLTASTVYISSFGKFSEGGKGRIYSFKKADGIKNDGFDFQADSSIMVTPAIGDDGTVYAGDFAGKIYGIDGSSGAKKWTFTGNAQEGFVGAAILHDNGTESVLYMQSTSGRFYAINTVDGSKKWHFDMTDFEGSARSAAVSEDGAVYISNDSGSLYALNNSDGAAKWTTTVPGTVLNNPVIAADGVIFTGAENGSIYAFSPEDGSILWNSFPAGSNFHTVAIGENGFIYAMSAAGVLYAFSLSDINDEYGTDFSAGLPIWSRVGGNQRNSGQKRYYLYFTESGSRVGSLTVTGPFDIVLHNGSELVANFADRNDDSFAVVNPSVDWSVADGDGCISENSYIIPAKNMSGTLRATYEHVNLVSEVSYISTHVLDIVVSSGNDDLYSLSFWVGSTQVESHSAPGSSTVKLGAVNPAIVVKRTDRNDGSVENFNASVTWTKTAGGGTLTGTNYTVPASGSGTLKASYTHSYTYCAQTYNILYEKTIVISAQ